MKAATVAARIASTLTSDIELTRLELRLQLAEALAPPALHLVGRVRVRQALAGESHPALCLAQRVEPDDHAGRAVLPVVAGGARRRRGALPELGPGRPALAERLVGERLEQPLDRHAHRPRRARREAVLALSGRAQPAGLLVADGERLRVPARHALLLHQPARDLGVSVAGAVPAVE